MVIPLCIPHKSIAGRYRPVRVAVGRITARCRFIKNASWVAISVKLGNIFDFLFARLHSQVLLKMDLLNKESIWLPLVVKSFLIKKIFFERGQNQF